MFVPLSVLEFRDRAAAFFGDKVGVSVWKKGGDEGTVWYVSGVTALLNVTILALGRARPPESMGRPPDRTDRASPR